MEDKKEYPEKCKGCHYYQYKSCHLSMYSPDDCPCKDCLVKPTCSVRCDEFEKSRKLLT